MLKILRQARRFVRHIGDISAAQFGDSPGTPSYFTQEILKQNSRD